MRPARRRILLAVDLSETLEPLAAIALQYAQVMHADLTVFHVVELGEYLPILQSDESVTFDEYVKRRLTALRERILSSDVSVEIEIRAGTPVYSEIVRAAQRSRADLILMGTHNRNGLERVLLGSVALGVLRMAQCPVTIVPVTVLANMVPMTAPLVATPA